MTIIDAIIGFGLIVATTMFISWKQRRGGGVVLSSNFLLAMGFGSLGISAFYLTIRIEGISELTIVLSRILWVFILFSTWLIGLSVISRNNGNQNG